jgi:[protein-PII] uridylyltransferase
LKLSHVAQRRDLADPQVAMQLAEEIGTLERLKLLYVHSVCDLKAVSPEAWTDWKGQLLAECYMRTAEMLGETHPRRQHLAPNLQLLRQKVLSAIKEDIHGIGSGKQGNDALDLEQELEVFLKHVSDRYIQASSPTTIARHFLMRRDLNERNAIDWRLQPDTGAGFSELTVAGADVPGLFSNICGALAAKDINIWSAQIFSTTDGFALNQFQVTDLENNPLPAGLRRERLRHDLNIVILGEKMIESLIEKHSGRKRYRPRLPSPLPSRVLIANTSSQECTVIEIRTSDRPGLLYRITRALSECQLDIQRSIITTEAYGVVDVFYVTDLEYNKIYDPAQRQNIEQTILNAVDL